AGQRGSALRAEPTARPVRVVALYAARRIGAEGSFLGHPHLRSYGRVRRSVLEGQSGVAVRAARRSFTRAELFTAFLRFFPGRTPFPSGTLSASGARTQLEIRS